jgi:Holliday junction DNA helicase RuvA
VQLCGRDPLSRQCTKRHRYNQDQMIAFLRGTLLEKHPNQAIVDTGGVGYDVQIPVSTYSALPEAGSEVRLRIYTHVREDALALFGFLTPEEKLLFEKLLTVSGIGPKLAITALSGLATPSLISAIRNSSVEHLVRIPGIGKKTAERIVLELKDKLEMLPGAATLETAAKPQAAALSPVQFDVLSALLNLGCQRANADQAVRKAKAEGIGEEFEPLFRRALEIVR